MSTIERIAEIWGFVSIASCLAFVAIGLVLSARPRGSKRNYIERPR